MFNKVLFLKGIECFKKLPGDKLISLSLHIEENSFSAEEEIDSLDSELLLLVHFLVSGEIKVTRNDISIAQIGSGQIFGSFFSGQVNSLPSFIALNNVKVYTVKQEIFDRILFDNPEFSNSLMSFNPIESL
jgi:signal-transduction protein with cAMP-binding, CBS, and nucleotidyltransferase domain